MWKALMKGIAVLGCAASAQAAPLMRFPTASKTTIAFVAYGDLWTVPIQGGTADRLTNDPGVITNPLFSPDGRWLAYTSQHGGLRDVYIVSAQGGSSRRLTHEASAFVDGVMVVAWTPDSRRVIFLSHRAAPVAKLIRAYSVPISGGMAEQLPLDRAGLMSFSPDGKTIAYNRIFRNLELRKRYIGGQAQDVYTYNFTTHALTQITDWKGTDTAPMWFGGKIYFLSDRGNNFRENIWSYDLGTKSFHQVTSFEDYDIDWPSLGPTAILFQQAGHLFAIDLPSEKLREVKVDIPDSDERTQVHVVQAGEFVRSTDAMGGIDYAISPKGDGLLLSARGDLFRVSPGSKGDNLTATPGADEDHPAWSPDGRLIAYETDSTGQQQLAVRDARGGPERILTHFEKGYFYTPLWSPIGDSLAVADANHSLWWIPLDGRRVQQIASDPLSEIRDASFSPDGRWLAYSTQRATQLRAIHLYELATGHDVVVSSPMESDRFPAFTPDGRFFVFVSHRNEQPLVSDHDDENLIATVNSDGLYAVPLARSTPSPAHNDVRPDNQAPGIVLIDLDGFMNRAVALPVTPTLIQSIQIRSSQVFYQTSPVQLLDGDLAGQKSALRVYDLKTMKNRVLFEGLDNCSISADGLRVALRKDNAWYLANTSSQGASDGVKLDLADLTVTVDPPLEWAEMFENAWRLDRDIFFSKVMNGTDWQSVHDAYARLVTSLGSQDDFLYLLRQVQGEIASSHTFMTAGVDVRSGKTTHTGLLAADYSLDKASGRYRFEHIYAGDQTRPRMSGPLGDPGLDVKDGDYLLAINGQELKVPDDPDKMLAGVTSEVKLTVSSSLTGSRHQIVVTPLIDEMNVRRHDWIEHNRIEVDRLSHGQIGYVFLTDFNAEGSKDFVRQFYPQMDKAGLVFDVRWNRGGFTSQAVLDVLRREQVGIFVNREDGVTPLPVATAPRAMVTLTNYASASDGDQFPYFFREYKLGKIVGERTWGGVQGINGPWTLMDGSSITIPKDSLASIDGHWVIENEGVTPDTLIEAEPDEAVTRDDSELSAAVMTALDQIKNHPPRGIKTPAPLPAYPPAGNVPGASFQRNRQ